MYISKCNFSRQGTFLMITFFQDKVHFQVYGQKFPQTKVPQTKGPPWFFQGGGQTKVPYQLTPPTKGFHIPLLPWAKVTIDIYTNNSIFIKKLWNQTISNHQNNIQLANKMFTEKIKEALSTRTITQENRFFPHMDVNTVSCNKNLINITP